MPLRHFSSEEITRRAQRSKEIGRIGRQLYQSHIRHTVETEVNIGKLICIDIKTGDYEIGDDEIDVPACQRLLARHPNAVIWEERIGYTAVYFVGCSMRRMPPSSTPMA